MTDKNVPAIWTIDQDDQILGETIRAALREVFDPELGLNIIQLGLIRDVEIKEGKAIITMILTTPYCPYAPALIDMTRIKAENVLNMPTTVEIGMQMWDFSMMEEGAAPDWGLF